MEGENFLAFQIKFALLSIKSLGLNFSDLSKNALHQRSKRRKLVAFRVFLDSCVMIQSCSAVGIDCSWDISVCTNVRGLLVEIP